MLVIDLKNTKVQRFPFIRVFIDEDLIEEIQLNSDEQQIKIPIAQDNGEHILRIEHFGKTSADTDFIDGKILQDTSFTIDKLFIDDFEMNDDILLNCYFIPEWSGLEKPIGFPDVLPQVRTIGPNGEWCFPFQLPIEDWLIHRIHNQNQEFDQSYAINMGQMDYELSPYSLMHYRLSDENIEQIKRIKRLIND